MMNKDEETSRPQEEPQTQKPSEIQADPALDRIVEKDLKPGKQTKQK